MNRIWYQNTAGLEQGQGVGGDFLKNCSRSTPEKAARAQRTQKDVPACRSCPPGRESASDRPAIPRPTFGLLRSMSFADCVVAADLAFAEWSRLRRRWGERYADACLASLARGERPAFRRWTAPPYDGERGSFFALRAFLFIFFIFGCGGRVRRGISSRPAPRSATRTRPASESSPGPPPATPPPPYSRTRSPISSGQKAPGT